MGQELQRRTPGTVSRAAPSWPTVAGTTMRLWFDRHYRRRGARRPLVMAASALVAIPVHARNLRRDTAATRWLGLRRVLKSMQSSLHGVNVVPSGAVDGSQVRGNT